MAAVDAGARHPGAPDESARQWLEQHGAGDVLFSPTGLLIDYNQAAARMFGVPEGVDLRGQNLLQFCERHDQFEEMLRALHVTGRLQNLDGELSRADGSRLHVVVNVVGHFDTDRRLESARAHLFNITEWRQGHDRTVFGQRTEAVGRLAGGIAHDFNNLLAVISGHAELLVTALALDDPRRRSASAIQEASGRAATLTRQLLAFGRRQVLLPEIVDVNGLVLSIEADLRRAFGGRIAVALEIDPGIGSVLVDPGQVESALGMLAAYRVDAIPHGGTMTFRTSNVEVAADRREAHGFARPGRYVSIEIADTGSGLDSDTQVRLFEPFFADSRHDAETHGLGLAALFGVIRQSGGYVWADGGRATGAAFTILLPVRAATP